MRARACLVVVVAVACGASPPPAPRRAQRRAVTPAEVSPPEPPPPCRALGGGPQGDVVDAFFRAHAQGRIDPNLVDAGGGAVPQTPLATELLCPIEVRVLEALPRGRARVALRLNAGGRDELDTEATLSPDGNRFRIEVASLARMRDDVLALQVRRFLRDHGEIEQLAVLDVPFGDDVPDVSGVSPRRRERDTTNMRLAFARVAGATTLCLVAAREGAASTRTWCWTNPRPLDLAFVGELPQVVDETVQMSVLLVPATGARAEVVELRFPDMQARRLDTPTVRRAPVVPLWADRVLGGAALRGPVRRREGAWAPLPAVTETPPWVALLASAPWLRAVPVASPRDRPATSITVDVDESRRWLAVHGAEGWALSQPLARPAPDGVTSWDGVESAARLLGAPEGTFVAWSSDFGGGRGAARMHVLVAREGRLAEGTPLVIGQVRAWWSGEAPLDPVAERLPANVPPAAPVRVAWHARYEAASAGAPGCVRMRRARAEAAHLSEGFTALPGRRPLPVTPESLPESVRLEGLPDSSGVYRLDAAGALVPAAQCD